MVSSIVDLCYCCNWRLITPFTSSVYCELLPLQQVIHLLYIHFGIIEFQSINQVLFLNSDMNITVRRSGSDNIGTSAFKQPENIFTRSSYSVSEPPLFYPPADLFLLHTCFSVHQHVLIMRSMAFAMLSFSGLMLHNISSMATIILLLLLWICSIILSIFPALYRPSDWPFHSVY